MGAVERGSLPARSLERARSRFQAVAGAFMKRGTRIPQSLWTVAVRLAKTHGVCRGCHRPLGLHYCGLKPTADRSRLPPHGKSDGPAFVEFTGVANGR